MLLIYESLKHYVRIKQLDADYFKGVLYNARGEDRVINRDVYLKETQLINSVVTKP